MSTPEAASLVLVIGQEMMPRWPNASFAVRDASFAVRALALLGTAGVLLAFVPGLLRQTAAQRET